MFVPVTPEKGTKVAELVARQIRRAILAGDMAEDDLLPPEPQLIAAFKVSRPTLREALRILEADDLVKVRRGARGGAAIKLPTARSVARAASFALQSQGGTLRDVYETRTIIEPPAAHLAAENRPTEAADALQAQLTRAYEVLILDEWRAIGATIAEFHQVLLEQCGNPALALVGMSLKNIVEHHQRQLDRARRGEDLVLRNQRVRWGLKSHQRLINLIRAGEGSNAERHWRLHMLGARDFWLVGIAARAVIDGMD